MSLESYDEELTGREIAIIGMAGRFPQARTLAEFWENLKQGREAVTFFSAEELAAAGVSQTEREDPNYINAGLPLDDADLFDAAFFGYTPRDAELLDPQQRLFLEHAWEALEHAGYAPAGYAGLIGVYAGVAWNTYLLSSLTSHRSLFEGTNAFQTFISNDKDFMPTRVSYKLNLRGPSVLVQTSCSTSLVAIHLACLGLMAYDCDMALVGGVTVKVPQRSGYVYADGGLASPDGHCRAFDHRAQGTVFGSGVGVVVLKRLGEALQDGDTIHAVIRGSAINNDGWVKVSYTAPSVEGQAEVIAAAQAVADVDIESIRYIETHGTGTTLGDPIEVAALTKVFRSKTEARQFCALGSVKTNVGHLDAAAGIAGLLKTTLVLKHGQIPPSLNYEQPNPQIDFAASPFFVNTTLREWPAGDGPRRAGVSSFGVGGTNAHVILEQAPPQPELPSARPWHLLLLSARSDAALEAMTARLAAHLRQQPDLAPADIAYTLQAGRSVMRHRRAIVCRDRAGALAALESGDPAYTLTAADTQDQRDRPVIFLFPGQGAQYAGMAADLYHDEPVFRETVDRCAELLRPHLNIDLREVLYPDNRQPTTDDRRPTTENQPSWLENRGWKIEDNSVVTSETAILYPPSSILDQTWLAQPALFVIEYALAQLWMAWGVRPQAMIGHSIGEYVAACLAGVFTLEEGLRLVAARGRLMQALPGGAMLAVDLPEADLLPLLGEQCSLAAVNEPARCVVAGPHPAIEQLAAALHQRGVHTRPLHTSHAFHSPMMEPILAEFAHLVRQVTLRSPQIPYISNVSGGWITAEDATDPAYWARHLRRPVRFAEGLEHLLRDPNRVLLEVGPGRTLSTFARRMAPQATVLTSLRHPQDQEPDSVALLRALGGLWLAGLKIDWGLWYRGERRRRIPLPTYPFERRRFWIDGQAALPAAEPATAIEKRNDPATWCYQPVWRPTEARPIYDPAASAAATRNWLVLSDGSPWAAQLMERLAAHGQTVAQVFPGAQFVAQGGRGYTINPRRQEDYAALLDALHAEGTPPEVVIHLWAGTSAEGEPSLVACAERLHLAGPSLTMLAQELTNGRYPAPARIVAITTGAHSIAGATRPDPVAATLLGPLSVIPQEYPQLRCQSIDLLHPPGGAAQAWLLEQVLAELYEPGPELRVAYRGGQRWAQQYLPRPLAAVERSRLRDQGVYLITGGQTPVGRALAAELARSARARLILLDDPDTLAPAARATAADWQRGLEELGAQVFSAEISYGDAGQIQAAAAAGIAYFGALHGCIHAAAGPDDTIFCPLSAIDEQVWRRQIEPKLASLLALEPLLQQYTLDIAVTCSSLATALGGLGYAVYSAANHALDALTDDLCATGRNPWISIGWDSWRSDDGVARMAALHGDLATFALDDREGGEIFRRMIAARPGARTVVSTGDLEARMARWAERQATPRNQPAGGAAGAAQHPRPLLATPYAAPSSPMERTLAEIWQRALGIGQIGIDDNFFELGGDSFIAVQLAARLKQELRMDIAVVSLYEGRTIRNLARLIAQDNRAQAQRDKQQAERKARVTDRREYQRRKRLGTAT